MGKVYSSSHLNICATAAVDGSRGLLFGRNRRELQIVQLRMRKDRQKDASPCFAHDAEFFIKSIDRAPLNRRGWVVQERLLSRCNLHFGANQLLWECCEMNACEIMPDGLVAGISRPSMKDAISTMRGLKSLRLHGDRIDLWAYGKWADIVRAYTEALLTHHTDRLVAISGLALIFQDFIALHYPTRPEYLAGIWGERIHVAAQLLWHAKRIRSIPESTFASIAPTWSWASVDGPISDIFKFRHTASDLITVTHPYAVTTLVTEDDIFGQVSSGKLILRGKLARISYTALPIMTADGVELPSHGIIKIQEYRPLQDLHWYTGNMDSRNYLHTNLWWDRLSCPGSTVANGRLFLLPIRGDHDGNGDNMEGLILESTDLSSVMTAKILSIVPSEFRRIGKWTAYNRASVDRVRVGCQYFDHAPEEADIDRGREASDDWRGKTYTINII